MAKTISIVQAKQWQHQLDIAKGKLSDAIEAVKSARALGDFSENADLDAAKQDLSKIQIEINRLEELLKADVEPYDHGSIISNGSIIRFSCPEYENGQEQLALLASEGTLMFSKVLSTESALGKAINQNVSGDYTVNGHVFHVQKELHPDLDAFFNSIKEEPSIATL